MPKNKALQAQQIDRDMLQGKEKQYQGVEKYTLRDGKEHTFVVTRTLFSFGDEKLILNSALDISELKETQSSLLHTKDELAPQEYVALFGFEPGQSDPVGVRPGKGRFLLRLRRLPPRSCAGAGRTRAVTWFRWRRYFAGVHPDYRQEAVRMIAELKEGKRTEFHETYMVHWFNEQRMGMGAGAVQCFPARVWAGNPFR